MLAGSNLALSIDRRCQDSNLGHYSSNHLSYTDLCALVRWSHTRAGRKEKRYVGLAPWSEETVVSCHTLTVVPRATDRASLQRPRIYSPQAGPHNPFRIVLAYRSLLALPVFPSRQVSRLSGLSVNRKGQNEWALRPGGGNMGLNHPGANAFPAHPLPPYPTACAQWGMPVSPGCRTFTLAPKGWQRLTGLNC